ncbi:MAG: ferrochelatase [Bacteroidia bacterium]
MQTGVLLVNLGTPDSAETRDVKRYLSEFLNDPRVIDISPIGRWMLVNLIIVPFRASKSAKLYSEIWRKDGKSPLLYFSEEQEKLLRAKLGSEYHLELAMRYQKPSIASALEKFRQKNYKKIIVLPMFPQYASATTGSVHEEVMRIIRKWEIIPEIEFINSYCDDKDFIASFAEVGRRYDHTQYDHVLMSFHGLPERQIHKGDLTGKCLSDGCCDTLNDHNAFCYRAQCHQTARKMAEALGIPKEKYTITFQSRLGKTPWIRPYSDETIKHRASLGDKKLLVFAPAFVSDCLETIHEIGVEYNQLFKEHGGEKIQLVESLNESPKWIETMHRMITGRN